MLKTIQGLFAPSKALPPSPDSMSAADCQALRQLLLLTQAEAAAWVGEVSERSWQYWESGRRLVPEDVGRTLRSIAAARVKSVDAAIAQIEAGSRPVSVWYQTADDWKWRASPKDDAWAWKLHNSVVSELAGRGLVELVGFDSSDFVQWAKRNSRKPVTTAGEAAEHLAWASWHTATSGACK